jgi:hypothetical protein
MFHNYTGTDEDNIQDMVLMENRDRDYDRDPIVMKGSYDLIDVTTELSRYAIELPTQALYLQISFSMCVARLGRPMIIGDHIELPSEAQYSADMTRVKKWLEVTDVGWSTEGYTPGWKPTMLRVVAQPAFASQETQSLFGDLARRNIDSTGSMTGEDGTSDIYQDFFGISETMIAEAKDNVPQRGAEGSSHIREFEQDELDRGAQLGINLGRLGLNSTGTYVEDAMPSNNAPYTIGDELPSSPSHGDYHRLTYVGLASDIPARLYRYSQQKGRWVYLETDRRTQYDGVQPVLQEFLTSPDRSPMDEITRGDKNTIDKDCT